MGRLLNEGELKGVDSRLVEIVKAAVSTLPYDVEVRDGMRRKGDKGNHSKGYAVDVQLIDPQTGKRLPNKAYYSQGDVFRGTVPASEVGDLIPGVVEAIPAYEQYAQAARVYQQQKYPELDKTFRWGGGFRGGGTPFDLMHLDITPRANGAMAYYDWDSGFNQTALDALPGIKGKVTGGLGGTKGARLVSQYKTALAGSGGLVPPNNVPGPAPTPADMPNSIRTARLGADDIGIGTAMSQATMSDELAYGSGRVRDVPLPRPRPVGPVANVAMPRARPTVSSQPPSMLPSLSRGIVDSARSPTLFPAGVGVPTEHMSPDAQQKFARLATRTGDTNDPRLNPAAYVPSRGTVLPNRTTIAGRPDAPIGSMPPAPWRPTVAGRPSVPGSLPAARPQSTITGRPDAPVGSMPAKRASAPVPAPFGQRPGSSAQAGPMETSSVRPLATQPTSNPSFAAPLPPKYITKTVQTANPDYRQVNPGNPTLAAMGFSPGTMPASAQVPQYLTKTVKAPNPAYQSALLAQQRAQQQAPIPATQSPGLSALRAGYGGGDGGLFGITMSRDMSGSLNRSSSSSSASQPRRTTRVLNSSGTGSFGTSSSGRRYNADTNRWESA